MVGVGVASVYKANSCRKALSSIRGRRVALRGGCPGLLSWVGRGLGETVSWARCRPSGGAVGGSGREPEAGDLGFGKSDLDYRLLESQGVSFAIKSLTIGKPKC